MEKQKQTKILIRAAFELGTLLQEMEKSTYHEFHFKYKDKITNDHIQAVGEYNKTVDGFDFNYGCMCLTVADWHGKPVPSGSIELYDEDGNHAGFLNIDMQEDFI